MNRHQRFSKVLILAGMVLAALTQTPPAQADPAVVPGDQSEDGIPPEVWKDEDGNLKIPSCTDAGYGFGFKLYANQAGSGIFQLLTVGNKTVLTGGAPPDNSNSVTVAFDNDVQKFDWSATLGIDAVIVAAANDANIFNYPVEDMGDGSLHAPVQANSGRLRRISHVEFCYDYELTVSKTAETDFTRTYEWDITKTANPVALTLDDGAQGDSQYQVSVNTGPPSDSDWQVSGTITIYNNTPLTANIESVTDSVTDTVPPNTPTSCGNPFSLQHGDSVSCTYTKSLPDGTARTNTVTVITSGSVGGGEGTTPVTFGSPTQVVNETIDVTDNNGESWQCSASAPDDCSWEYAHTFACPDNRGVHTNVATIEQTGQTASASVTVTCNDQPPPESSELFCLWPPNHKYYIISKSDFGSEFTDEVDKACPGVGDNWTFESCTSDQSGGGCTITRDDQLCVEADRQGSDQDGRRYTVKINSTPACAGTGTVGYIQVPHDQSNSPNCRSGRNKSCP